MEEKSFAERVIARVFQEIEYATEQDARLRRAAVDASVENVFRTFDAWVEHVEPSVREKVMRPLAEELHRQLLARIGFAKEPN